MVGIRQIDVGNIISPTTTNGLVVVTQLDPISLIFTLPEGVLPQIQRQQQATKTPLPVLAYNQDDTLELGKGVLALVNNEILQTTGSIQLKATFSNKSRELWPGELVNARLLVMTRHNGLTVPASVVQQGPNGAYAYVIKPDDTVAIRPVKVAQITDGEALIDSGLKAGETGRGRRTVPAAAGHACHPTARRSGRGSRGGSRHNRRNPMNISAPFIQRPIATALLMVGLLVRSGRLSAAADRGATECQLSDASGHGAVAGRRSADHGGVGRDAARTSVRPNSGSRPDDLDECTRLHPDHAAVRPEPPDRRNGQRYAVGDQRREPVPAARIPYPPTIRKVNPADTPILVLGLTSDSLPLTTVDAYAENILLQKISQIPGVGLVGIGGQQKPAVRVQLDPQALAARGINLEDVRTALGQANVDLPKGTLNSPRQTYTLNTNDQLLNADDYANLVIAYRNGSPVRIRDVGRAVSAPENDLIAGWYNNQRAVILAIQRQPGANVIDTVERIKAMMPVLQASIPPAVKVHVISDRTDTVRASIHDVQFTLILTVALVVMVIFVFLRNFWATVIPAVTVPLSLVGTFGVLYESATASTICR